MTANCAICDTEFQPKRRNIVCCSDECREERRLKIIADAQRERRAKQRDAQPVKECEVCGKEFRTNFRTKKVCSKECKKVRLVQNSSKYYAKRRKPAITKECEICRRTYQTAKPNQRTCGSNVCQLELNRANARERLRVKNGHTPRKEKPRPKVIQRAEHWCANALTLEEKVQAYWHLLLVQHQHDRINQGDYNNALELAKMWYNEDTFMNEPLLICIRGLESRVDHNSRPTNEHKPELERTALQNHGV